MSTAKRVTTRCWTMIATAALGACATGADPGAENALVPENVEAPLYAATDDGNCDDVDWTHAKLQLEAREKSQTTQPSLQSLSAQVVGRALCVRAVGTKLNPSNYNLFIETDGKLSTGVQTTSWLITGADYFFSGGPLYAAGDSPVISATNPVPNVRALSSPNANELRFRFPLDLENVKVSPEKIGLGFQLLSSDWNVISFLPEPPAFRSPPTKAAALAQVGGGFVGDELRSDACDPIADGLPVRPNPRPGRAAIPVTRGIIAPTYLGIPPAEKPLFAIEDPKITRYREQWEAVRQASILMAGKQRDYWVVVTGAGSAPPATTDEWKNARAVWEPISASGGHLIGYVHTAKSNNGKVGPALRPLSEVEAEIERWVTQLDSIDGIWLDEFLPQFELVYLKGAQQNPPDDTNRDYLPADPHIRKYGSDIANFEIDSTCGYYDRLTRWIRASYPWLRIVGNTGAPLISNQDHYARLVDVFVGFEQSLVEAQNDDWATMIKGRELVASARLALVHAGKRSDTPVHTRKGAIDEAFALGYTHVYATDALFQTDDTQRDPTLLGDHNVWGDLPVDSMGKTTNLGAAPSATTDLNLEIDYVSGK